MIEYSLSLSDLSLIDGFDNLFKRAVREKEFFIEVGSEVECLHPDILKVLHTNGMNIDEKIILRSCAHRNLQGNVVSTVRFEGVERTDKEWLKGGASSFAAQVFANPDVSYRQSVMEHMTGSCGLYEEVVV